MLLAYRVDDWVGRRDGRSVYPMWMTSLWTWSSPGTVVSTLPPASAAISTITEPGFMLSTISWNHGPMGFKCY